MVKGAQDSSPQPRAFPARRYRIEVLALFSLLVLFAMFAGRYQWLQAIDHLYYDALLSAAPATLDERIVIVGVDEQSLAAAGRWPWPRSTQAQLIASVMAQSPKALLVDVVYSNQTDPAADASLVRAFTGAGLRALPIIIEPLALNQPPIEVLPFPDLLGSVDVLGHVHVELDRDSISRGTYLYQGIGDAHWPHLALALARALEWLPEPIPECSPSNGAYSLANQRCAYTLLPFVGPPGSVPAVSALELLDGSVPPSLLQDKVVLLGLTAAGVADWVTSPVSGGGRPISGVEYNANLFNALIQDQLVRPAPAWLTLFLCGLFAAVAAVLLPRLAPKAMLATSLLLAIAPFAVSAVSLLALNRYLPLSAAAVAALLAYPYWSWRRHEIAWRYIDQEMSRIAAVKDSYITEAPTGSADWSTSVAQLARLLDLDQSTDTTPTEEHGMQVQAQARRVTLMLDEQGTVRLFPSQAASTSRTGFTEQELALIEQVGALLLDDAEPAPSLPGESLAARIRVLRNQNRLVQLGRATSMQALEEMASGVGVMTPLGKVVFANSQFLSMTGVVAGSALFADDAALHTLAQALPLPIGRNWLETWREVVTAQRLVGFESKLRDGRLVYVSCAPLDVDEAGTWVMTITDVTEITTAQNMREEALAFLSHDLRSPILSVLALIRRGGSAASAEAAIDRQERDRQIERYAQKSLTVSEQFLQLSRLESQSQVETYELDVLSVLDNAIDQVYAQAQDAEVALDRTALHKLSEDSVLMLGNGELLERAFVNLLSNAVKYSDAGDVVQVRVQTSEQTVEIAFADEGAGIPDADLPNLFDPYFRSSEPGLARRRGAGLGLRFTKTVVERHGGSLLVESTLGQGSIFTLVLPRIELPESSSAAEDA